MVKETLANWERIQIAAPKSIKPILAEIRKATGERIWEITDRLLRAEHQRLKDEGKV